MKSMIALALVSLSFSSFAALIPLSNPRVIVSRPSQFTPVQPTAHLQFEVTSCSKRNFRVSVEASREDSNTSLVKVDWTPVTECEAVGAPITYTLQLSSDHSPRHQYILLNPLPTK